MQLSRTFWMLRKEKKEETVRITEKQFPQPWKRPVSIYIRTKKSALFNAELIDHKVGSNSFLTKKISSWI
jgi:hypothetical protein